MTALNDQEQQQLDQAATTLRGSQEGTPDYVNAASTFRTLRQRQLAGDASAATPATPAAPAAPDLPVRPGAVGVLDRVANFFVSPEAKAAAANATPTTTIGDVRRQIDPNPYSAGNTADRVFTSMLSQYPDLAATVYNQVGPRLGGPRMPLAGPSMRANAGAAELPADASATRQLLEGGAAAALGGGARGAINTLLPNGITSASVRALLPAVTRLVSDVALPTVGAKYGGDAGYAVGGETGGLLGAILGGGVANPTLWRRGYESAVGSQAKPNAPQIAAAAETENVPTTAGMLGNQRIQALERRLSGTAGGGGYTNDARNAAMTAMNDRMNDITAQRGAVTDRPTPGTVGQDITDMAGNASDRLGLQVSNRQQGLQDRIGVHTPLDVTDTLTALQTAINSTDPATAAPLAARLRDLRQMLLTDTDPATGQQVLRLSDQGGPQAMYGPVKDFRTNQRIRREGQDPVPARFSGQVYDATTGDMRGAAQRAGISPADFDEIQRFTAERMGRGGPVPYFDKLAGTAPADGMPRSVGGRTPEQAYNLVINRGQQSPGMIRPFADYANPNEFNAVMGDALRQKTQATLGSGGAPAGRTFANWWNSLPPESQRLFGGSQTNSVGNIATLAEAHNYPTSQTGLTRAFGGQVAEQAVPWALRAGGAWLGHKLGIPGGEVGGFAAGEAASRGIQNLRARLLQSEMTRNALTGTRTPLAPQIPGMVGAINASGY